MRWQAAMTCAALVVVVGCSKGETAYDSGLCGTIPTEMLERLSGDYASREDLLLGREQFVGCDADGMSSFEFGIQIGASELTLEDHLTGEVEEVDGLGDEAYRSRSIPGGDLVGETVVARQGDRVVLVRNDLLHYGPERATEEDTIEVVNVLFDLSTDRVASIEKVVVAAPCPSVDQASRVLGDVKLARAQDVSGTDGISCSYYSSDGVRLLVSSSVYADPAEALGNDDPVDVEGATAAEIYDGGGGGFEITALVEPETVFRIGATSIARADDRGAVDREAVVALAEDVIASS